MPFSPHDTDPAELASENARLKALLAQTLRESRVYRQMFRNAPIGLCVLSQEGRLLACNEAMIRCFALGWDEVGDIGPIAAFFEDRADHRRLIRQAWRRRIPDDAEVRLRRRDGRVFEALVRLRPISFERRLQWHVVVLDIGAQKRAEAALRESEQRYKSLYAMMRLMCDNAPDMIWAKDLDNRYLFANKAMCVGLLNATDTDEPVGKNDMFFAKRARASHPDRSDWHTFGEICRDSDVVVLESKRSMRFDEYGNVKGRFLFLDVHKALFRDESGAIIGTVGCARDVTADRDSTRMYRYLVEHSPDGILILQDGRVAFSNAKFAEMVGAPLADLMGRSFLEFLHPEERDTALQRYRNRIQGFPEPPHYVMRGVDARGRDRRIAINTGLIEWGGRPATLNFLRDVTAQYHAEQRLAQRHKLEAIGTLASGIAHDFNNILTAIIGFAELAEEETLPGSSLAENLAEVIKAGDRARNLVRQILTFSRVNEEERRPAEIAVVVKEALKMLRATLPTTIDIRSDISSNALIMGNPTQIHQILINLCANAGHSMKEDGGTLFVGLSDIILPQEGIAVFPGLPPGDYVRMEVTDTGQGIAPDVLPFIFEPYFTTKGQGEGTGLGLAVVHGIVKSHGGDIAVASMPERGATFMILLPRLNCPEECRENTTDRVTGGEERILVVDDEDVVADSLRRTLMALGYRITVLHDPEAALALIEEDPSAFDLVVTDMTMPRLTGDVLALHIQALRPDLPVILCTGFHRKVADAAILPPGVSALIMKPMRRAELASLVRRVLDGTNTPERLPMPPH